MKLSLAELRAASCERARMWLDLNAHNGLRWLISEVLINNYMPGPNPWMRYGWANLTTPADRIARRSLSNELGAVCDRVVAVVRGYSGAFDAGEITNAQMQAVVFRILDEAGVDDELV